MSRFGKAGEPASFKGVVLNFLLSALLLRNTDCLESAIFSLRSGLLGREEQLTDLKRPGY